MYCYYDSAYMKREAKNFIHFLELWFENFQECYASVKDTNFSRINLIQYSRITAPECSCSMAFTVLQHNYTVIYSDFVVLHSITWQHGKFQKNLLREARILVGLHCFTTAPWEWVNRSSPCSPWSHKSGRSKGEEAIAG